MSEIILCNMRSEEPYYISELNIRVFSIEEMAYFVYRHTSLVGREFFGKNFTEYIRNNLKLERIAEQIEKAYSSGSGLPDLVCILLKESGYYSEEEIQLIIPGLPELAQKSTQERIKSKADMFFEMNKYESALQEYYRILEMKRDPKLTSYFYSCILGKMALIYSRLFLYEDAVKYYTKAYELSKEEEYLRKIAFITMLKGGEKELLGVAVKFKKDYEYVEIFREELEKIVMDSKESATYKSLLNNEYSKEDVGKMIEQWKEEYRNLMV